VPRFELATDPTDQASQSAEEQGVDTVTDGVEQSPDAGAPRLGSEPPEESKPVSEELGPTGGFDTPTSTSGLLQGLLQSRTQPTALPIRQPT
jgi:hypothetical protein